MERITYNKHQVPAFAEAATRRQAKHQYPNNDQNLNDQNSPLLLAFSPERYGRFWLFENGMFDIIWDLEMGIWNFLLPFPRPTVIRMKEGVPKTFEKK